MVRPSARVRARHTLPHPDVSPLRRPACRTLLADSVRMLAADSLPSSQMDRLARRRPDDDVAGAAGARPARAGGRELVLEVLDPALRDHLSPREFLECSPRAS